MQLCCVQKSQGHQSELVQHREGLQDQASCKMFNISSRSFFTMLHCQIKLSRLMYIGKKKKKSTNSISISSIYICTEDSMTECPEK